MSSVITPRTYDMLERRKFNPWGTYGKIVPAFPFGTRPRSMSTSAPKTDRTKLSMNQLQNITFDSADNGKVVTVDMELGAKPVLPTQMKDVFPVDGLGNLAVKAFSTSNTRTRLSYQVTAINTPVTGKTVGSSWDTANRTMDISQGPNQPLGLQFDEYLTHLIMSVYMESPNAGMWMAFSTTPDNLQYDCKVISNVSNTQTLSKPYMEGQTFILPVQRQPDLSWPSTLYITHNNMGKYIVHIRGIMYRKGIT